LRTSFEEGPDVISRNGGGLSTIPPESHELKVLTAMKSKAHKRAKYENLPNLFLKSFIAMPKKLLITTIS
jgi:hypothetical protein